MTYLCQGHKLVSSARGRAVNVSSVRGSDFGAANVRESSSASSVRGSDVKGINASSVCTPLACHLCMIYIYNTLLTQAHTHSHTYHKHTHTHTRMYHTSSLHLPISCSHHTGQYVLEGQPRHALCEKMTELTTSTWSVCVWGGRTYHSSQETCPHHEVERYIPPLRDAPKKTVITHRYMLPAAQHFKALDMCTCDSACMCSHSCQRSSQQSVVPLQLL